MQKKQNVLGTRPTLVSSDLHSKSADYECGENCGSVDMKHRVLHVGNGAIRISLDKKILMTPTSFTCLLSEFHFLTVVCDRELFLSEICRQNGLVPFKFPFYNEFSII